MGVSLVGVLVPMLIAHHDAWEGWQSACRRRIYGAEGVRMLAFSPSGSKATAAFWSG
jgi:hypothetical protein